MKAVAVAGLGLFVVSVVAMAGCHHRHEVIVEREGPPPPQPGVVVEEAPPDVVVVQEAPPALVVERDYGPAPGPDYVWVGGYYSYYGHHYVWQRGRWGRPPYRGAHWESHRWVHVGGAYHYHRGGWHR